MRGHELTRLTLFSVNFIILILNRCIISKLYGFEKFHRDEYNNVKFNILIFNLIEKHRYYNNYYYRNLEFQRKSSYCETFTVEQCWKPEVEKYRGDILYKVNYCQKNKDISLYRKCINENERSEVIVFEITFHDLLQRCDLNEYAKYRKINKRIYLLSWINELAENILILITSRSFCLIKEVVLDDLRNQQIRKIGHCGDKINLRIRLLIKLTALSMISNRTLWIFLTFLEFT